MTDSLEDYGERLLAAARQAAIGTDSDRENLLALAAAGARRRETLDDRSRAVLERIAGLIMGQITELASGPSSPEQRAAQRVISTTSGIHYTAQGFLDSLERPPVTLPEFVAAACSDGLHSIQEAGDVAHDVNAQITSGEDMFAFSALITECIQESMLGIHTLRHGLPSQALAHCRAVYEDLDLLELFRKDREAQSLWLTGDNTKIRKALAPVEVRKKLGRTMKDVPYAFYSELGTHTSMASIRSRSRIVPSGDETLRMEVFVTGTWQEDGLMPACMGIVLLCPRVLLEAMAWCEHFKLAFSENQDRLDGAIRRRARFAREYTVPWMRRKGIPEDVIARLDSIA